MRLTPGLSRIIGILLSGMILTAVLLVPSDSLHDPADSSSPADSLLHSADSLFGPSVAAELGMTAAADGEIISETNQFAAAQAEPVLPEEPVKALLVERARSQSTEPSRALPKESQAPADNADQDKADNNEATETNTKGKQIVTTALAYLGKPYVYGGSSPEGFDCSGFTQYVYQKTGISLPRSSYAQFAAGSSVSKSNLQAGDLVFFTTYAKGASHVGIYLGDGTFIHANNSRVGVVITDMGNSYYAARYLGAKRY